MVDSSRYPLEVVQFLSGELRILEILAADSQLLIEVGCMDGRYLSWAIDKGLSYLGIDVVPRYIEAGKSQLVTRRLPTSLYRFTLADACELASVLAREDLKVEPRRSLILFPFNSLGNMTNVSAVIENLARADRPFLISTYRTTRHANESRLQYYESCGYTDIRVSTSPEGICFLSAEGLSTIAYHPDYLLKLFERYGLMASSVNFSSIGIGYIQAGILRPTLAQLIDSASGVVS